MIAFDLDGTILNQQKKLSPENEAAVKACIKKGIHVVPATGRMQAAIPEEIMRIPGIRYGIVANGAEIRDFAQDRRLDYRTIDWETAYDILSFLSGYPVAYDPFIEGRGKTEKRFLHHLEAFGIPAVMKDVVFSTRDIVENELEYLKAAKTGVEKINVFTADRSLRKMLWEKLSDWEDIVVTSSLDYNLEINAKEATKGKALFRLAKALGIAREQTMSFGDGSNDLSMIESAGIGIAMENGIDMVKEKADYITLSNDQNGVAAAIYHFIPMHKEG